MFQDMRINHSIDNDEIRCNKVHNMINMIRNDIIFEKPIFDYDTLKIAQDLTKEIEKLLKIY